MRERFSLGISAGAIIRYSVVLLALFLGDQSLALAYVGPGLGAGTLAAVLGLLISILLALVAIVWYPLKRLIKKLRKVQSDKQPEQTSDQQDE